MSEFDTAREKAVQLADDVAWRSDHERYRDLFGPAPASRRTPHTTQEAPDEHNE